MIIVIKVFEQITELFLENLEKEISNELCKYAQARRAYHASKNS